MPDSRNFFSIDEKELIQQAILNAELDTSGEIRVHIENNCEEDVLDRAAFIFHRLKMDSTEKRNGVLFYLALKSHKFAILGDKGINAVVPEDFWESTKNQMRENFREGDFAKGLSEGIAEAGVKLKAHFPYQSDDVNELPDEISFGKID